MSRMVSRGALIVFEGCDRCGKTTQCKKLVETLKAEGRKIEFWRYPERDTAIGKVVNDYLEKKCELEDHAVHLLFAANRWETVPKMRDLLQSGTTLIVDRYSFSGVAFSGAKEALSLDWCIQPEIGLPKPDAVIYLDLSTEEAAKRGEYGGERYERTDFQRTVAENYNLIKDPNWKYIDANKSIDDLHLEIKGLALSIMENVDQAMPGGLWLEKAPTPSSMNGAAHEKGDSNGHSNGTSVDAEPCSKKARTADNESTNDQPIS